MADYPMRQFFGTVQTVYTSSSVISASNFSVGGTVFDNTSDTAVPFATHAVAMIQVDLNGAPSATGQVIELWGVNQDVNGAGNHETDDPATTYSNGARFLGAWVMDDVASVQRRETVISLEGIKKFKPFIKNGTSAATESTVLVTITPFSFGTTVA